MFAACCIAAWNGFAQGIPTDDRFTISEATIQPGGEYGVIQVGLQGSRIYTAYNLDCLFPEGVDVYYEDGDPALLMDEDGIYPYTKTLSKKTYTHTVGCTYGVVAPKDLRVACTSNVNGEFTATSGSLFLVGIVASPYAKPGTATLSLSGLNLTVKENAVKYVPANEDYPVITVGTTSTVSIRISSTNQYSTLVLPIDAAIPEGLKAYSCSESTDEALLLREAASFEAYKPYILYAENGFEGTLSGTVDPEKYVEIATEGLLSGAVVAQQVSKGYVLQNQGEGAKFYAVERATFNIPEGRCWINEDAITSARAFNFEDITSVAGPSLLLPQTEAYDLSGRRVSKMEAGRIYVVNGRKILKLK